MAKQLQLTIPTPCHENWDGMTPSEKGKFCGSCQKQVIDFSNMSDRQVAQFFKKPSTGSVCGRFMSDQLDRAIEIPKKRIPWLKYFFQIALPAFFVSKAGAQTKTMGTIAAPIPKDTIQKPNIKQPIVMGRLPKPVCIKPVLGDTIKVGVFTVKIPEIKGRVVDEFGDPVPFASIQTGLPNYFVQADELGRFTVQISTLSKEKILHVTAAGFESRDAAVVNMKKETIIQLKANVVLPEVVLNSTVCRRIVGMIVAGYTVVTKTTYNAVPEKIQPAAGDIHVFPNPVSPGSAINISFKELPEGYYSFQLLNMGGQTIKQEEIWIDAEARILNIDLPKVAAGSYFLILTNKKTGKQYSEKIILQ